MARRDLIHKIFIEYRPTLSMWLNLLDRWGVMRTKPTTCWCVVCVCVCLSVCLYVCVCVSVYVLLCIYVYLLCTVQVEAMKWRKSFGANGITNTMFLS